MLENVITFFEGLESRPLVRLLFVVVPILLLWFLENGFPLQSMHYRRSKGRHALINFIFTFMHFIVHGALAFALVWVSDWCQQQQFGLVHWMGISSAWGIILAGILSMDFAGGWLVHWVEHKVPLFWRIHIVHHADNNVDVSTGLRHHPLEALNRWVFFIAGVWVMGLPVYAIMIGQTFMSMFTMFTHANIRLPEQLDKAISWVFVSPNMHKVHHHWKQPFTDSNYGTALSIWDRLLGTFRYMPPAEIRYGLDRYYDNARDEDFGTLVKSPFEDAAVVTPPTSLGVSAHPLG
jgi:sterol desaturase/sphingolipid hydroxylase (fatty acid hydroxylase superfamily)